jgi:signal transduction histidine kinase
VSAADAMAAGNYDRRVPPHEDGDELGRLAATFNTMAEQVASSDEELRLQLEEVRALAARLEEANVAAESAREEALVANRVKSEFLATMSHEIRTPISVVLSYVDLLKAGVPDRPTPRQQDYLRQIDQSSHLLLWLLNDLLDYSKLESDQMRIALGTGFASDAIQAAVAALEPSAMQKNISLTSRPCDATFHADQHRVHQIVLNLVSNAIKYTPAGGSVVVGCEVVGTGPPDLDPSGETWVRIDVEDTGIGIAPESISRIFEPFVRCEDESAGRHGGAGLGLAISQRLAALMSGTITVESAPGEGSRFTLWLPTAPASVREDAVIVQHAAPIA